MEEFAEEADDKSMIKLLKYYRKHHGMRMSRYIAVKLHQTKHVLFIELLTEKLKQEAANYPNRSFGKEADERSIILYELYYLGPGMESGKRTEGKTAEGAAV